MRMRIAVAALLFLTTTGSAAPPKYRDGCPEATVEVTHVKISLLPTKSVFITAQEKE